MWCIGLYRLVFESKLCILLFYFLNIFFLSEMKKLKIKLCEMVFLGGGSVFSSFYKQRLSPVGGGNEICESNPSCAAGLRAVVHSRNESGFLAFHWASKEMQKACFFNRT